MTPRPSTDGVSPGPPWHRVVLRCRRALGQTPCSARLRSLPPHRPVPQSLPVSVPWLFMGAHLEAGLYQGVPLPRAELGARARDRQRRPFSARQLCSGFGPHAGPSGAGWPRVCLHAPAAGPWAHSGFLEGGLLSRAAVCSAVVKSGLTTTTPNVKAGGGKHGAGDRKRSWGFALDTRRRCCLRGTGSCLPVTRMVSCPPLCGRLRVKGFSLPPLAGRAEQVEGICSVRGRRVHELQAGGSGQGTHLILMLTLPPAQQQGLQLVFL